MFTGSKVTWQVNSAMDFEFTVSASLFTNFGPKTMNALKRNSNIKQNGGQITKKRTKRPQ